MATTTSRSGARGVTRSRTTTILGWVVLAAVALLLVLAFVATDADQVQDDAVRLMYIHVPSALTAYTAFLVTAIGSGMVLYKKSVWWDLVAGASAEIGALAAALALITGSIWGRPIWNTWWEWGDVRLLTTLVLFMLSLGYLAVRRLEGTADQRAKRSAVVGVLLIVNVIIVNRSVEWWADQTIHQESTIAEATIEDLKAFTLYYSILVGLLAYSWMLIHRFRLAWLERQHDRYGLDEALRRRREEGASV